jgi:hypothetical protein
VKRVACVLLVCCAVGVCAQNDPASWPQYGHDAQRTFRNDFVSVVSSPGLLWTADGMYEYTGAVPVVDDEGRVYACSCYDQCLLHSFDAFGNLRWVYPQWVPKTALLPQEYLVGFTYGSWGNRVDFFSLDGVRLWALPCNGWPEDETLITAEGLVALRCGVSGSNDRFVEILQPLPDTMPLEVAVEGYPSNLVQGRDGALYFATTADDLHASLVRVTCTGQKTEMSLPFDNGGPYVLCLAGDSCFYGLVEGDGYQLTLVRFDVAGEVGWARSLAGYPLQLAVGRDGTVYVVTCYPDQVVAVSRDGEVLWSVPSASYLPGILVEASGNVIVGDSCGEVRCYGPDGGLRWSRSFLFPICGLPALGPAGLEMGLADGFMYCFEAETRKYDVTASVTFEGRAPGAPLPSVEYDLRLPGSGWPFLWRRVAPEPDGTYLLTVPEGEFDISVKADKWLSSMAENVPHDAGQIEFFCYAGDTNNDDVVDTLDLNAVLLGFGGDEPDLNLDGMVDLIDLNYVLVNFGKEGKGR